MKTMFILASASGCVLALAACSSTPDSTGTSDQGLVLCAKSACGPALGIPNYVCPDGHTVAGPTGDCISTKADPTCHWQVISCPPTCTPEQCGPEPLLPTQICADGGTAGPVCESVDGVCGWHITTCNDDCTKAECGPEPLVASQICPDGGVAGPICERVSGVCGWHITTCGGAPAPGPL